MTAAEQMAIAFVRVVEGEDVRELPPSLAGTTRAFQQLIDRGIVPQGPAPGPTEADELWGCLDVREGHRVVEAVLVAKIVDFSSDDKRPPSLSMSATDGMDWVQQYGILHGALALQNSWPFQNVNEEE